MWSVASRRMPRRLGTFLLRSAEARCPNSPCFTASSARAVIGSHTRIDLVVIDTAFVDAACEKCPRSFATIIGQTTAIRDHPFIRRLPTLRTWKNSLAARLEGYFLRCRIIIPKLIPLLAISQLHCSEVFLLLGCRSI
jgi:hypothetical protein